MNDVPRPSHADFTYQAKYGTRASSGGGRSSARETIGRVASGAIAEKILREEYGIEIVAWVSAVGEEQSGEIDPLTINREQVDRNLIRCPDASAAGRMEDKVREIRDAKDSIGGVVSCVCRNVPAGWGEPVFDKLDAMLAHAMLSLPATKGFEVGSGFSGTCLRGSQHNDPFIKKGDRLGTVTNHAGGVLGGISSGEPVLFRVAFKPVATIGISQETVGFDGKPVTLEAKGRHDPCVVPRAVPIVESMAALVLLDLGMRQKMRSV
jgi:chorismate synthase